MPHLAAENRGQVWMHAAAVHGRARHPRGPCDEACGDRAGALPGVPRDQRNPGRGAEAGVTDDDAPIALTITRRQLESLLHLHRCLPSIGGGPCRSCDVAQNWLAQARLVVHPMTVAPDAQMPLSETRAPARLAPRATK
jgi:hypothetical protein